MSGSSVRTHYDNLQVARTASDEVIRGAYRYLSQKYHPDKQSGDSLRAEQVMRLINEAYEVLSDPDRRRAHDEWIAQEEMRLEEEQKKEAGAQATAEESARPVPGVLSSQVRGEYARSIARSGLMLFVIWAIVAGLLNVAFWSLFPPIARFMERHEWVPFLIFVATAWTVARETYDKKVATVSAYDDDRLQVAYGASGRRNTVAIIAASILAMGVAIVWAILFKNAPNDIASPAASSMAASQEEGGASETSGASAQAPSQAGPSSSTAHEQQPVATTPEVNLLEDNPTVVEKNGAYNFDFTLQRTALVKLVVSADGDMPIDVITIPQTSKSEYMDLATKIQMSDAVSELDPIAELLGVRSEEDRKNRADLLAATDEMFRSGISKRGVYRQYESAWVKLREGTYSIFIDNTDAFTPARADAPVKIQLYYR